MKNTHVHLVDLRDTDYPNQSSAACSGPDGICSPSPTQVQPYFHSNMNNFLSIVFAKQNSYLLISCSVFPNIKQGLLGFNLLTGSHSVSRKTLLCFLQVYTVSFCMQVDLQQRKIRTVPFSKTTNVFHLQRKATGQHAAIHHQSTDKNMQVSISNPTVAQIILPSWNANTCSKLQ